MRSGPVRLVGLDVAVADQTVRVLRLRFQYTDRDGIVTRRHVESYRLALTGRRWYLVARDPMR